MKTLNITINKLYFNKLYFSNNPYVRQVINKLLYADVLGLNPYAMQSYCNYLQNNIR